MLSSASTRHLTNRDCNRFGGSMTRQTKGVEARRLALSFTMAKSKHNDMILAYLSSGRLVANLDNGDVIAAWSARARGCPARTISGGYKAVMINNGGVHTPVRCSRVVCIAAYGLPPTDEHQVNHKNGIKTDDRACNVEWVTQSENMTHAYKSGLRKPRRRFSDDQAKTIMMMRNNGMTWVAIGESFGCDERPVRAVSTYGRRARPTKALFLKGASDD